MRTTAPLLLVVLSASAALAQGPAVTPAAPSDEPKPSERTQKSPKKDDDDTTARGNPARSTTGAIAVSESMRFKGFDLAVSLFDSSGVYFGAEGYTNSLSLWLEPSFALGKRFFEGRWAEGLAVSLRLPLEMELTGNDPRFRGTGYVGPATFATPEALPASQALSGALYTSDGLRHEPVLLGDLWISVAHGSLAHIPKAEIDLFGSARAALPTSVASRNAGLLGAFSLGASADRTFGPVTVDYTARFTKYAFSSPVSTIVPLNDEFLLNGRLEPTWHPASTTVPNPDFGVFHGPAVTWSGPYGLSASVTWLLFHTAPFALPSSCAVPGLPLADVCADTKAVADTKGTPWRVDHWFQISADWQKGPVSLSLGLSTYRPLYGLDGKWSQPFAESNRNNYTTVYLSVSSSVEAVVDAAFPKEQP